MASFKEDTEATKREFEALSNSTQILIWSMVAIGVLIGLVLGGAIAYGVAVEEVDGQDCIELDDELYCADQGPDAEAEDDAEVNGDDDGDTDGDDELLDDEDDA